MVWPAPPPAFPPVPPASHRLVVWPPETAALQAGAVGEAPASLLAGVGVVASRRRMAASSAGRPGTGFGCGLGRGPNVAKDMNVPPRCERRCPPPGSAHNTTATLKERPRSRRRCAALALNYWSVGGRQEGGGGGGFIR